MLKVRFRSSQTFKCPKHPRQQYEDYGSVPASCEACRHIADLQLAIRKLDLAERNAARWMGQAAI